MYCSAAVLIVFFGPRLEADWDVSLKRGRGWSLDHELMVLVQRNNKRGRWHLLKVEHSYRCMLWLWCHWGCLSSEACIFVHLWLLVEGYAACLEFRKMVDVLSLWCIFGIKMTIWKHRTPRWTTGYWTQSNPKTFISFSQESLRPSLLKQVNNRQGKTRQWSTDYQKTKALDEVTRRRRRPSPPGQRNQDLKGPIEQGRPT